MKNYLTHKLQSDTLTQRAGLFIAFVSFGIWLILSLFIALPVNAQSTCTDLGSSFGSANYSLTSVVSGNHRLWLRVKSTDGTATLRYNLSGGGTSCNQTVSVTSATSWRWVQSSTNFSTTGGTVAVQLSGTKAGVGVDCFVLTSDTSFAPSTSADCAGPQIVTPPPPPSDTTPPQVSLTAPANNATVSGSVTVSSNATDNVGVTRVSYFLDGSPTAFSNDTSAPYTSTWTSTTVANGNHTIRATATDAAGLIANSQTITINVQNTVADTTRPTTAITSPANNTTAIGTITIGATATDNIGVTRLELLIDGTGAASDLISPYSFALNTTTLSEGSHTLTTRAYDAANNQQLSNPVVIIVDNIPPVPLLCADQTANNVGQPLPCTYTTPPPTPPPTKPGDTDNSGAVDRTDLRVILFYYGRTVTANTSGDLNGDGKVDRNDLRIVLFYYGK